MVRLVTINERAYCFPICLQYLEPTTVKTWSEALSYADRSARTVHVTLPRSPFPPNLQGKDKSAVVDTEGSSIFISDVHGHDKIVLNGSEIRPLALALLARHYDKEQV